MNNVVTQSDLDELIEADKYDFDTIISVIAKIPSDQWTYKDNSFHTKHLSIWKNLNIIYVRWPFGVKGFDHRRLDGERLFTKYDELVGTDERVTHAMIKQKYTDVHE